MTSTDRVAAARSNVAAQMFRAITRIVLFDRISASSSTKRVDDTGAAGASSPARAAFALTSISAFDPSARSGRSQAPRLRTPAAPSGTVMRPTVQKATGVGVTVSPGGGPR